MGKTKEDLIVFETFLQRLKYNSKNFHVILFSSPKGYEYDTDTGMIRPLNSILWYNVRKNIGTYTFVDFLNSYCESCFDKFEKDYYDDSINCISNYNGHMSVDLDKLGKNLKRANRKTVSREMLDSFSDFTEYIDYLYTRNEKLFEHIIEIQEDLL